MGRPKKQREPLPPIWEASDALWEIVEPILLDLDPPAATGRKRIDPRAAFDAIIFRLRTGCQWNHLPAEYPDDSSVHRTFQRWVERGVFPRLWATVADYQPHIALIRDERPARAHEHKPKRWVGERSLGWLSMCRGILIRWEKKSENYLAMLQLACGLIWFRRYHRLANLR
jgi:transposase